MWRWVEHAVGEVRPTTHIYNNNWSDSVVGSMLPAERKEGTTEKGEAGYTGFLCAHYGKQSLAGFICLGSAK